MTQEIQTPSTSLLLSHLNDIEQLLAHNEDTFNPGLLLGQMGICVFYSYLYALTKKEEHRDKCISLLSEVLTEYPNLRNYDLSSGITGIHIGILELNKNGIIDDEDTLRLNSGFESFLDNNYIEILEQESYDYIKGYTGLGSYLLQTRNQKLLRLTVDKIQSSLQGNFDTPYLDFVLSEPLPNSKNVSLGLAHGIPSVIIFLAQCCAFDSLKDQAEPMVRRLIAFMEVNRSGPGYVSIWPSVINTLGMRSENSRLGWCYGDLGVALSYLAVGIRLNDESILKRSFQIFVHSSQRRDLLECQVKDAQFCHGSLGIAYAFKKASDYWNDETVFQEAHSYWMDKSLEFMSLKNEHMYKSYSVAGGWKYEPGILEGLAGMGLVLISMIVPSLNGWEGIFLVPSIKK